MTSPDLPHVAPVPPSPEVEADDQAVLRLLKGTDDSLPARQILRDRITATLREAFASFGFSPCETPILHYFDILASKYAGGAEILKETYKLIDQGGRELGLRYDLTVPFARLVGMYHEGGIRLPFKRFEIGRVFRDGPVRAGRRREFYQCDVDMVGSPAPWPDAELMVLAATVFERLGLDVRVELNHRRLLSAVVESCGVPESTTGDAILSLDKLKKIGPDGVMAELQQKGLHAAAARELLARLAPTGVEGNNAMLAHFEAAMAGYPPALEAINELRQILATLDATGLPLRAVIEPTLARGLDIYTGPVFEFFLEKPELVDGAVAAGGRYDRIIESFLAEAARREGRTLPPDLRFPTVGMSFGLEPLSIELFAREERRHAEAKRRLPETVSEVLLVPLGTHARAQAVAMRMRAAGVRVEVETRSVKLKKAFQRADVLAIPFVAFLGDSELAANVVTLKNQATAEQVQVTPEEAARVVRAFLGGA